MRTLFFPIFSLTCGLLFASTAAAQHEGHRGMPANTMGHAQMMMRDSMEGMDHGAGTARLLSSGVPDALGNPADVHIQNDSAAVAGVVDQYHRALAAGDTATVLRLLSPDAIILESGGMETRAEYLSHHLPGDIAFARAVARERGPIRVVVHGDVAWATSTSTVQGTYRDRAINSAGAELMVLTRAQEEWKIAAIHWSSRPIRPQQ